MHIDAIFFRKGNEGDSPKKKKLEVKEENLIFNSKEAKDEKSQELYDYINIELEDSPVKKEFTDYIKDNFKGQEDSISVYDLASSYKASGKDEIPLKSEEEKSVSNKFKKEFTKYLSDTLEVPEESLSVYDLASSYKALGKEEIPLRFEEEKSDFDEINAEIIPFNYIEDNSILDSISVYDLLPLNEAEEKEEIPLKSKEEKSGIYKLKEEFVEYLHDKVEVPEDALVKEEIYPLNDVVVEYHKDDSTSLYDLLHLNETTFILNKIIKGILKYIDNYVINNKSNDEVKFKGKS